MSSALHAAGDYQEKLDRPDIPFSDAARAVKNREIAGGVEFSLGGSLQHRYQALDNRRDFTYRQNDEDFSILARERVNLDIHYQQFVKVCIEAQDAHEFFRDRLPGTNPNENSLDIYQAYGEIGLLLDIVDKPALVLRAGRQEFVLGQGHIFSSNDWLNQGQNFDMVRAIWRPDGFQIDAFAGWPVVQDHRNADSPSSHRNFAGANLKALGIPHGHTVEGFAIYTWNEKIDFVGELPEQRGPERVLSFGGRADGKFLQRFDYNLDFTYQVGERAEMDVNAFDAYAELGYTLPLDWRTVRFAFAYSVASGDENPDDGRTQTFDPLFGDQFKFHSKLLVAGARNLEDINPKVHFRVWRGGLIEIDYHIFYLNQAKDAFYAANGRPSRRNVSGQGGRNAGREFDFQVTHTFHENLSVTGGVFLFQPGRLFDQSGNRGDDLARSFFVMVRVGF
ncbi:MAG TPA: alginate export family protein [Planctomycetota bacterium]|nr:alginate export family protein [Planctomycetota bacterium]